MNELEGVTDGKLITSEYAILSKESKVWLCDKTTTPKLFSQYEM